MLIAINWNQPGIDIILQIVDNLVVKGLIVLVKRYLFHFWPGRTDKAGLFQHCHQKLSDGYKAYSF